VVSPATRLGAGTYHLVAAYGGSTTLPASASAAKTVIVTPAGTTARLSLSAAAVTQPKEAAERFTVQVSPRYAAEPAGTVVITAARAKRTVRVCELTLKAGRGSCALPAKKLAAGTYRVSASYQGDNDFRRSVTAAKTLMISK
jgi:pyocin large subunit-like protein